jgi:hypothetical protein
MRNTANLLNLDTPQYVSDLPAAGKQRAAGGHLLQQRFHQGRGSAPKDHHGAPGGQGNLAIGRQAAFIAPQCDRGEVLGTA